MKEWKVLHGIATKPKEANTGVQPVIQVRGLSLWYGQRRALKDINIDILPNLVTAIIGPSGCGKSTFLKTLNRMISFVPGVRTEGEVLIGGRNILDANIDLVELRSQVGMVFQKPNPFPKSIFDNVAYGPRLRGVRHPGQLQDIVERSLRQAGLWDEVKDRLKQPALSLSGGQQQRLCIARALAVEPDILLMDEPASALDPVSTARLEDLIQQLQQDYTVVIVTHNMQQAARVSQETAFFLDGELVEFDRTDRIFTRPRDQRTEDYVTGRFG